MPPETEYRLVVRLPSHPAHLPAGYTQAALLETQAWFDVKDALRNAHSVGGYEGIDLKFVEIADGDGRKEIILGLPLERVEELKSKTQTLFMKVYETLKNSGVDPKIVEVKQILRAPQDAITLDDFVSSYVPQRPNTHSDSSPN